MAHPTAFPRVEFQPLGPESRDSTCPENRLLSMPGFRNQGLGSPTFDASSPAAPGGGGGEDLNFFLGSALVSPCLRVFLALATITGVGIFHNR